MWNKNYKTVPGIVTYRGTGERKYDFQIDFEKLLEITNHHEEFVKEVKTNFTDEIFNNIEVYRLKSDYDEKIVVVFDHFDTFVRLYACSVNTKNPLYTMKFSMNKTYLSMMANLL
ncbi:hypothetical protein [Tuberibacillus calidus]|jgi:hypothetical protein|uniref:hypothetical protein n=1 Tax=Tuberibacillus calidus TaxID=340097 RepID=UPI000409BB1A|nr:hypothetical protein [Tuberibacillus calidus]